MKKSKQPNKPNKSMTDVEIIIGLQEHNPVAERAFYNQMLDYYNDHFDNLFIDSDLKEDIFQSSLIKLWTEIENKRIRIIDQKICRQSTDGVYRVMTASLTTFFITFAKNEHRESLREIKNDNIDIVLHDQDLELVDTPQDDTYDLKCRLIDECIQAISPKCVEILTKFYFQHKTLDIILSESEGRDNSKGALKTAKSKCLYNLRKLVLAKFAQYNISV